MLSFLTIMVPGILTFLILGMLTILVPSILTDHYAFYPEDPDDLHV